MDLSLNPHLSFVYWSVLAAVAIAGAIWEAIRPARKWTEPRAGRWLLNTFLAVFTRAIEAVVFRLSPLSVAVAVSGSHYSLLGRAWLPLVPSICLAIVLLDLYQYASHYLHHSIPFVWRLHQVHHADRDVDVSTGLRFHPGDAILVHVGYVLTVAILAPPPIAVFFYDLTIIAQGVLSHANFNLPVRMERAMRTLFVTPSFHAVHHRIYAADQRSNLGVVFSFWDNLFHTYRGNAGSAEQFGLEEVSAAQSTEALAMLSLPFQKTPAGVPVPQ